MPTRWVGLTLVVALVLTACGGSDDDAAGCGDVQKEALDPTSASGHVLPGASEPRYQTDPPTSGPHQSATPPRGVLAEPLPKAAQVALLEHGEVLVQHRDLSSGDRDTLERLAGDDVTVAPNPNLPSPVVATAWTYKLTCERVDVASLRAFIRERRGQGTEH